MNKKEKLLYILSLVFLALTAIGGILALAGFFSTPNIPVLQLIGAILLVLGLILSTVVDLISKKKPKKKKEK